MTLLRWLTVGCVAVTGLVMAFAAGMWCKKLESTPTANAPTTPPPAPIAATAKDIAPSPPTAPKLQPSLSESPKPITPVPPSLLEPFMPHDHRGVKPADVEKPSLLLPVALPRGAAPQSVPFPPVGGHPPTGVVQPIPIPMLPDSPPHHLDAKRPQYFNTTADKPPVVYVNKPNLEFEYDVGKKGKSGVKAVNLFVRDPAVDVEVPRELKAKDP